MLWENYTKDWRPISAGWQNQQLEQSEQQTAGTSHVAIGGHTAMVPQQIIEGARQLLRQQRINAVGYRSYVDETVRLFQQFAAESGALDWSTGALYNGIRVEEKRLKHRRLWGTAGWQQAELIQTLIRLREEERLKDVAGPDGKTGEELLEMAERQFVATYTVPENYSFNGLGNPDVYHRPQLAQYHHEVISKLGNRQPSA
jgi:hypothetical protein